MEFLWQEKGEWDQQKINVIFSQHKIVVFHKPTGIVRDLNYIKNNNNK